MEPYAAEWWSIVPPIVAIGLALLTKEVFSSLLVGIFTGTLIYAVGTDANIVMGTLETAFTMMAKKWTSIFLSSARCWVRWFT